MVIFTKPNWIYFKSGLHRKQNSMYWHFFFFSLFQFSFDFQISQQPLRSCECGLILLHGMEALWYGKSRRIQKDCEWYFSYTSLKWEKNKLISAWEIQIGGTNKMPWQMLLKSHLWKSELVVEKVTCCGKNKYNVNIQTTDF